MILGVLRCFYQIGYDAAGGYFDSGACAVDLPAVLVIARGVLDEVLWTTEVVSRMLGVGRGVKEIDF